MTLLSFLSSSGVRPPCCLSFRTEDSSSCASLSSSTLLVSSFTRLLTTTFPVVTIDERPRAPPAGNSPPQLLLEDLARSSKLSEGVTPVCLVAYSIGGGVGKLGLGVMADVPCVDGTVLYSLTVGVSGLAVVLVPLSR